MKRDEIKQIVQEYNVSASPEFKIDGPWAWRGLEGFEAELYIFEPGAVKKVIGKAKAKIEGGLLFEIELDEEYKDIDLKHAAFEVPMRFSVSSEKEKS